MAEPLDLFATLYPGRDGHEGCITLTGPDGLVLEIAITRWRQERPGVVKAKAAIALPGADPQSDADLAALLERKFQLVRGG
jgi:hypothetical protein